MTITPATTLAAMTPHATSGTSSSGSSTSTNGASNATNSLANEQIFIQLLVAQLKNQDPENPADGTTFVTQLAQFSTLGVETQSGSDLDAILKIIQTAPVKPAAPAGVNAPSGANGVQSQTGNIIP
jgi:flagellar hook assembly protein FlgD